MSRVGKHIIKLPSSISCTIQGQELELKSKNFTRKYTVSHCLEIISSEVGILLNPKDKTLSTRSLWGTDRSNVQNIVTGLDKGFSKNIDLVGVGYRGSVSGGHLVMQLGFSHDIIYAIPKDITIKCEKPTLIVVSGPDKQKVSQVCNELMFYRKPEPYKGKGVIPAGFFVVRKEGKKK